MVRKSRKQSTKSKEEGIKLAAPQLHRRIRNALDPECKYLTDEQIQIVFRKMGTKDENRIVSRLFQSLQYLAEAQGDLSARNEFRSNAYLYEHGAFVV